MAQQEQPDLIITDYHMPQLSGLELCQRLKQDPATGVDPRDHADGPRATTSSPPTPSRAASCRMLSKPFSPRQLLATVNEVLGAERRAAEGGRASMERADEREPRRWTSQRSVLTACRKTLYIPTTRRPRRRRCPAALLDEPAPTASVPAGCLRAACCGTTARSPTTTPPPGRSSSATSLPLRAWRPSRRRRRLARHGSACASRPPAVGVWNVLPGVVLAAFPHVEKQQQLGVIDARGQGARLRPRRRRRSASAAALGLDGHLARQAGRRPARLRRRSDPPPGPPARRACCATRSASPASRTSSNSLSEPARQHLRRAQPDLPGQQRDEGQPPRRRVLQAGVPRRDGGRWASAAWASRCTPTLQDRPEPAIYGQLEPPAGQDPPAGRRADGRPPRAQVPAADQRPLADHALPLARPSTPASSWPSRCSGRSRCSGCLFVLDKIGGEFDSVDSKLLNSIANESAIYLENAMLFEDVHGLMMGLLHSLTSAVDAKDAYTCGHSERVALLSRQLAAADRPARRARSSRSTWPACCTTSARSACPRRCCRRPAS